MRNYTDLILVPDFRSSTGLFNTLRSENKLKASGKHLFDASVYQTDSSTSSFHDMVRSLSHMVSAAKPTAFHQLLATLASQGRLMRLYTQNVDGIDTSLPPLETTVPLSMKGPWPRTIQLHGGLEKMVCSKCNHLSDFEPALFDGPQPPFCTICMETDKVRTDHAGKRSHGIGKLRPRIVLYNEHNPDEEAIGAVVSSDLRSRPDAVIVVGTSMKIPGVKRIVREMCGVVRGRRDGLAVWINHEPPPVGKEFEHCWDLIVTGGSDEVARQAAMRRWDDTENDFKECTESEVERAKKRVGEVKVIIESPRKINPPGLPTPMASPHPKQLKIPKIKLKLGRPPVQQKKKPTAASNKILFDPIPTIKTSKANTSRKPKRETEAISKASKTTKISTNRKINATFKVTKGYAQTTKQSCLPSKPQETPLTSAGTPSIRQTDNSSPTKPPHSDPLTKVTMPSSPMAPLSPQSARNNGPLPSIATLIPDLPKSPTLYFTTAEDQTYSQRRNSGIVTPPGTLPPDLRNIMC